MVTICGRKYAHLATTSTRASESGRSRHTAATHAHDTLARPWPLWRPTWPPPGRQHGQQPQSRQLRLWGCIRGRPGGSCGGPSPRRPSSSRRRAVRPRAKERAFGREQAAEDGGRPRAARGAKPGSRERAWQLLDASQPVGSTCGLRAPSRRPVSTQNRGTRALRAGSGRAGFEV